MQTVFTLLYMVCPLAALLLIARLVCAPFSRRVSEEMRRHPIFHMIWGCFAFVGLLVVFGIIYPGAWPPASLERRTQRQKVVERVESAGGWAAIQRDCDALAQQYRDGTFYWHRGETNALPPALAALNPWDVRLYSPAVLREVKDEPKVAVLRIKIFGMHSSGGHSTPYFGLEVVSGAGAENYKPRPSRGGVSGNANRAYRQVTDRIYEIY